MELKKDREGTKQMQNCGLVATVIKYNNCEDITIEFTDGAVSEHKKWSLFIKGKIGHPSKSSKALMKARLGKELKMANGFTAKIIHCHSAHVVDVEFIEDGAIVKNVEYGNFIKQLVAHPTIKKRATTSLQEFAIMYYLEDLGFRKIEKGEWKGRGFGQFELDFYHDEANIAIEFDGGFHETDIQTKRDLDKNNKCKKLNITLYRLRVPRLSLIEENDVVNYILDNKKQVIPLLVDCKQELEEILSNHDIWFSKDYINFYRDANKITEAFNNICVDAKAKERVGQVVYNKSANQEMKIVKYRSAYDVDIQFSDKSIVTGRRYHHFLAGKIKHPSKTAEVVAEERIGQEQKMLNGHTATIIRYGSQDDIDVLWDDGVISKISNYGNFCKRSVQHPNQTPEAKAEQRLGEVRRRKDGLIGTLVVYRNSADIDVLLNNGKLREHTAYSRFKKWELIGKTDTI